jgi:cellobiose transport system permease protein
MNRRSTPHGGGTDLTVSPPSGGDHPEPPAPSAGAGQDEASPRPTAAPDPSPRGGWRQRLAAWDVRFSPYLYISPFFVLFGLVGLFPLVYTAYVSVHDWSLLGGQGAWIGLENYRAVLDNPYFVKQTVNTISIFLLSSGPQVVIAVILAATLDAQLRARTFWRMSILLPFVVSPVAVGIIFGSLFGDRYGLVNEMLGVIGIDGVAWHTDRLASHVAIATMVNWRWTGYNALIFLAAMQAVPRDLYESAELDGAGKVRQFLSVTLPMIRPTMIFVIITSTIGGLQIFAEPRLFDETSARNGGADRQFGTITMLVYDYGWQLRDLGRASATAWMLFLLICVFALLNYLAVRRFGLLGGEK